MCSKQPVVSTQPLALFAPRITEDLANNSKLEDFLRRGSKNKSITSMIRLASLSPSLPLCSCPAFSLSLSRPQSENCWRVIALAERRVIGANFTGESLHRAGRGRVWGRASAISLPADWLKSVLWQKAPLLVSISRTPPSGGQLFIDGGKNLPGSRLVLFLTSLRKCIGNAAIIKLLSIALGSGPT